jgi:hypothetical protein
MPEPIITRSFNCEGSCGEIIEIPAEMARAIAYPNGTLREGVLLLCDPCAEWLERTIENAHKTVKL